MQVAGSEARAEAAVLQSCKGNAEAQMLYSLGIQLGISSWQEHWLQLAAAQSCQPVVSEHDSMTPQASPLPKAQQPAASDDTLLSVNQLLQSRTVSLAAHSPDRQQSELGEESNHDNAFINSLADSTNKMTESELQDSLACQQVVSNIRKNEFGIGVELNALGTELQQKQNDRLGRALQRLSQDLYSKDVHFVLELVQNADDNVYSEGICPAVEFILNADGITILNNEVRQAISR